MESGWSITAQIKSIYSPPNDPVVKVEICFGSSPIIEFWMPRERAEAFVNEMKRLNKSAPKKAKITKKRRISSGL